MSEIITMITSGIIFIILAVQAYSDHKTMELYYWLNVIGILVMILPAIVFTEASDWLYIMAAIFITWLQQVCGAYAKGDTKLFIMIIEVVLSLIHI